mmetsp:Transcript_20790/g.14904  ORF Transcript_20790/g.14904 Transcript_20790/m.14904 type:complete len:88 (+) Transcript_20790:1069-1332(+)|eukprot:CAMPEP_0116882552 /NCGR_PEP_ID=MMETSP0463-20121206/14834_1 /TAXON_ID=181622 /ORGANISM="Strombidinopsis sp, Strain SopsisLIS2011" /LENGTH=87 /DNA_ID=CAMNT_0004535951 /DNA_START=1069 /DNA_END=1332 /DNA_ORIENTATION=+
MNDFAPVPIKLFLYDDPKIGLKKLKEYFATFKKSLFPFGVMQLMRVISHLPQPLSIFSGVDLANRFSMTFSNVPGAREPMTFAGTKS